jgi:hypothetical protein
VLCQVVCTIYLQSSAGLTLISTSHVGGMFSCHFRRSIIIDANDKIYDLDQAYYLLLATGPIDLAGTFSEFSSIVY